MTACTKTFKVGDCVVNKYQESWQPKCIQKIIKVGKSHYLMCFPDVANCMYHHDEYMSVINDFYEKTECP